MKKGFSILLLIFTYTFVSAQTKQLTMEEAVLGGRGKLYPTGLAALQFIPGTNDYAYVSNTPGSEAVLRGTSGKAGTTTAISVKDIVSLVSQSGENGKVRTNTIKWKNATVFEINAGSNIYTVDINAKSAKLKGKDFSLSLENADVCDANGCVAYTKENNLFISDKGNETQVTSENNDGIVFGASNVHRNEFGISKGTFWSPKGNAIAFYRMDQRMVKEYPIINWSTLPEADYKTIKYPMAGGTSHQVTLAVYNLSTKTTVYMKTGGPDDHYLTNIAWSPDEKSIYIAELNRDQNYMKLNEYDALTGEFKRTLFEEKDEKYTEPLNPMLFLKNNPAQFIWESRRDGFNHLYLYDVSGKLIKQLTSGNWEVLSKNGFDAKGERLFFHANGVSPVNKDFYCVNLKKFVVERITSDEGTHACKVSDNGNWVIDEFTNTNTPGITRVVDVKTKKGTDIFVAENPLKEYALGNVRLFTIKANDGTPLWCRMYKPVGFDSTKKYPVIVYLYGGPHHQEVTNVWQGSWNLWYQYMAERGFIVFSIDNRGSGNRGKAFEQATFRNLGTVEIEDQMKGVEYLKSLPYVDAERMGVHGWSFGGFMTTNMMTRKPGTFKAGVGGGPVIDWKMYEIMYTERYMDTPEQNPEGYAKSELFQYIPNLKGKLLLIHGTDDDVVVWQHSVQYVKRCVDKGVQLDYFMYPGHPHNVRGKDRVHLMTKVTEYFMQHL